MTDIAIVGMAGRFPGAENIDELVVNLATKKDSVGPISSNRIKETGLPQDREYKIAGYLEGIDKFDHNFFNLSFAEAETMDPHQRTLLEIAYQIFENGGVNPDDLKDSDTCVYVSEANLNYHKLANEILPILITGNTNAILASRISRFFHFSGNSAVIDTTCSSALVALQMACNELWLRNSNHALVCSCHLELFPDKETAKGLDIDSPEGKSKAFSAQANGMSYGEAVAGVLLKPLDAALQDGNIIHAVIKSIAVNNNAGRSASITAPDSVMQSKVILKACQNAGISPSEIGCIEAHGSGTLLGDSIEISGIDIAFESDKLSGNKKVPISTIKSNIGHSRNASGMAGLIKTILSIKYKKIFPSLHYEAASPLINFDKSNVYINTELQEWQIEDGKNRIAGLSSIGLSGINCHVILTEGPSPDSHSNKKNQYLIVLSGRSRGTLERSLTLLHAKIQAEPLYDMQNISYTLAVGRKHYAQRWSCIVSDRFELLNKLTAFHSTSVEFIPTSTSKQILVLDDSDIFPERFFHYLTEHKIFSEKYNECIKGTNQNNSKSIQQLAFQYAFFNLLKKIGVDIVNLVGVGIGRVTMALINEEISIKEAIKRANAHVNEKLLDLDERLDTLVAQETTEGHVVFIGIGYSSELLNRLQLRVREVKECHLVSIKPGPARYAFLEFLKGLYDHGIAIHWSSVFESSSGRRIELPGYSFDRIRCWIEQQSVQNQEQAQRLVLQPSGHSQITYQVACIWAEILDTNQLLLSDNFFTLGGDSLRATKIIKQINLLFKINLSFEDIFDFPVLDQFSAYIVECMGPETFIEFFWSKALGKQTIGLKENFFELGGHSLMANQIINQIQKQYLVDFSFDDFYQYPTIQSQDQRIRQLLLVPNHQGNSINKISEAPYYDISPAQRRLWTFNSLEKEEFVYNEFEAFSFNGIFNKQSFEKSVRDLMERHESLRSVFCIKQGSIKQAVRQLHEIKFEISYSLFEENLENREALHALMVRDHRKSFDLHLGPLMRLRVIEINKKHFIICFTIHHIISDALSATIVFRELVQCYNIYCGNSVTSLSPLSIQSKDIAHWQIKQLQSKHLEIQGNYWKKIFETPVSYLLLPTDKPRSTKQTFKGRTLRFSLTEALSQALRNLAANQGVTLFAVLTTAVKVLLYRYTGQQNIIIGFPVSGRNHSDLENQVGFFVNMLPLRSEIKGQENFLQYLKQISEGLADALNNQAYPFDVLVDELVKDRKLPFNSIFNITLQLQTSETQNRIQMGDGLIQSFPIELGISKYDITFFFKESGSNLIFNIEYNTTLFNESRIRRLGTHLENIINSVTQSIEIAIDCIEIVGPKERLKLQELSNHHSWSSYPDDLGSIHRLFEKQAIETPNKIAISFNDSSLTYKSMNNWANRLANFLIQEHGVKRDELIAVYASRSLLTVPLFLGILKAGATYLPIDPMYPENRISYILKDANAKALLFTGKIEDSYERLDIPCLFIKAGEILQHSDLTVEISANTSSLAYVIYTSGTTGKPKGVAIRHSGIANTLWWRKSFYELSVEDINLQLPSLAFDSSVEDIWSILISGGKLIIPDETIRTNLSKLIRLIEGRFISHFLTVPSFYQALLEGWEHLKPIKENPPKSLKMITLAGETVPKALVKKHYTVTAAIRLINEYGPTENSVVSSFHELKQQDETIYIGKPCSGTSIYILNDEYKVQPIGVPGELFLSGVGLAEGYLNNPELTAEKFILPNDEMNLRMYRTGDMASWNEEGILSFLGRVDSQLKVRGYRVELEEIRHVLLQLQEVRDAYLKCWKLLNGDSLMIAYYVPRLEVAPGQLRVELLKRLPVFMIPHQFMKLNKIPRNLNGKVDVNNLPEPGVLAGNDRTFVVPKNRLQEALSEVWKGIFELESISITEDFFFLGGNSIKAMKLMSGIYKKLLVDVEITDIYNFSTIKLLAERISGYTKASLENIVSCEEQFHYGLSISQKRLWILYHLQEDRSTYNISGRHDFNPDLDSIALENALMEMLTRHQVLRTVYFNHEGSPRQNILAADQCQFNLRRNKLNNDRSTSEIQKYLQKEASEPFDLEKGPVIRARLLHFPDNSYTLIITMHHIASDGWSMDIFVRETLRLYHAFKEGSVLLLKPLVYHYKDYLMWQTKWITSQNSASHKAYWEEKLNHTQRLKLPRDSNGVSADEGRGATYRAFIDPALYEEIVLFKNRHKASFFQVLLTGFNIILFERTGDVDILIGTSMSGRLREELKNIIGFFLNTVILRNVINPSDSIKSLLEQVKTNLNEAIKFQNYPFERALADTALKDNGSPAFPMPFFITMLDYEETKSKRLTSFVSEHIPLIQGQKFEIDLFVKEYSNAIELECNYRSDYYRSETIESLIQDCIEKIQYMIRNETEPISGCLSAAKASSHQGTSMEQTALTLTPTIVSEFKRRVQVDPNAIVIKSQDLTMTYDVLDRESNRVANAISKLTSGRKEQMIAILVPHGIDSIVAILGVLKSGNIYVPLEPDYPENRITVMLLDSGVNFIIVNKLTKQISVKILKRMDKQIEVIHLANLSLYDESECEVTIRQNQIAYLLFTSGSSGKPKGVLQTHRNVLHFISVYSENLSIKASDRLSLLPTYAFDAAVMDIYAALLNGASLYPYNVKDQGIAELPDWLAKERISILHTVPTLYRAIVGSQLPNGIFFNIRFVVLGGEAVYKNDFEKFNQHFSPDCLFVNGLGPTESTVALQNILSRENIVSGNNIPVGHPVKDTQVYLLNQDGTEVEPYGIGEIVYVSQFLSPGYLNDPKKTDEVFFKQDSVNDLRGYKTGDLGRRVEDGAIEFLGRIDNQVKIRGYRIELAEVEAALGVHPALDQAVVMPKSNREGNSYLAAYLIRRPPFVHELNTGQNQVMDYSLFFFSSMETEKESYHLVQEAAKYADTHGFTAVWTPERHFHPFAGVFPDPAVLGAALAVQTKRLRIRAGSVVLPLHDEIRVIEQWSVIDNLSQGRVGISIASGWHADDFVFFPNNYNDRVARMFKQIKTLKALWEGKGVHRTNGTGQRICLKTFPRPIQPNLPLWISAARNPDTFQKAGEIGANIITHFLGQDIHELSEKIAIYKEALISHGHATDQAKITLMLHTYIGDDLETVKKEVEQPFKSYLRSSVGLVINLAKSLNIEYNPKETQGMLDELLDVAFERYWSTSALMGTPESCKPLLNSLYCVGVNEIACLIDFGIPHKKVMQSLTRVKKMMDSFNQDRKGNSDSIPPLRTETLKSFLQLELPDFMVPSEYNFLQEFPQTLTGKIDRKALLLIKTKNNFSSQGENLKPVTEIQKKLASIWESLLNRHPIGLKDNFFECGGNSLKALLLISNIRKELNIEIKLRSIFKLTTIQSQAEFIGIEAVKIYREIFPLEKRSHYDTSHSQRRIWLMDQLDAYNTMHIIPIFFQIEGPLDLIILKKTFTALIERHESLRTTFAMKEGTLKQLIHDPQAGPFNLNYVDLSVCSSPAVEALKHAEEIMSTPFDLGELPLMHVRILRITKKKHILLLGLHHIICDGWSTIILMKEMDTFYSAFQNYTLARLEPLKIQYRDFAEWQNRQINSKEYDGMQLYWRNQLRYPLPVLELPLDYSRQSSRKPIYKSLRFLIDENTVNEVKKIVQIQNASVFMFLLSTVSTLLHRITLQEEMIIGTSVGGRDRVELEGQVGCYVNLLPLRLEISHNQTFAEILGRTKLVTVSAFENQSYPFDQMLEDIQIQRTPNQFPLFDVLVVYLDKEFGSRQKRETKVHKLVFEEFKTEISIGRFDLTFRFHENESGISFSLDYNSNLFRKRTIEKMIQQLTQILEGVTKNTGIRVTDIIIEEKEEVIHVFEGPNLSDTFNSRF